MRCKVCGKEFDIVVTNYGKGYFGRGFHKCEKVHITITGLKTYDSFEGADKEVKEYLEEAK